MSRKILSIVGARPQFVKAAVVSRCIIDDGEFSEVMIHTGQHYDEDMSAIFFDELAIPAPSYNLAIGSGNHGMQTGRMLEKIEEVILLERPDWVVVYGDTNSTLAGALAASKLHVPVAHVEAGLRSFNKRMPEEQNRIVTDHLSDLLLTPTETANKNLENEGVAESKIVLVGDVMFDATRFAGKRANNTSSILERLGLNRGHFILATVHRAENTDDYSRLAAIFGGLDLVNQTIPVVLPLHPRTKSRLEECDELEVLAKKFVLIEPVGYFDMMVLEQGAAVVATDSGGVQKEAYFHEKPCVTLRNETEWLELVELGWNRLQFPSTAEEVANSIMMAVGTTGKTGVFPYGDGKTGQRIIEKLKAGMPGATI